MFRFCLFFSDYEEDFEADDEGPAEEEHQKKCTSQSAKTDQDAEEKEMSESEDEEKNGEWMEFCLSSQYFP